MKRFTYSRIGPISTYNYGIQFFPVITESKGLRECIDRTNLDDKGFSKGKIIIKEIIKRNRMVR